MIETMLSRRVIAASALLAVACIEPVDPVRATRLEFRSSPLPIVTTSMNDFSVQVEAVDETGARDHATERVIELSAVPLDPQATFQFTGVSSSGTAGGLAVFTDLRIDHAGKYRLLAKSAGLDSALSDEIQIFAGPPAQLLFDSLPPAASTAGTLGNVWVSIRDAGGNLVATASTSITMTASEALFGTTTASATNDLALFNDLAIRKSGSATLTATSTGGMTRTSSPFTVQALCTKFAFTSQPQNGAAGQTLPAFSVYCTDDFGNSPSLATQISAQIAIEDNPTGATLSGTISPASFKSAVAFTDLKVDKAGTGYTFAATGSFPKVKSAAFNVTP